MVTPNPTRTHTASGRQRRPTEKENYRVSESQHVNHRREDSERKLERQRKKKLRANYQANPGVFEQEPSELHSEVDREEDTIFSSQNMVTKLSNTNTLKFSTGKIPRASASNNIHSTPKSSMKDSRAKAKKVSPPSNNGDVTDSDDHDDDTSDSSSMTQNRDESDSGELIPYLDDLDDHDHDSDNTVRHGDPLTPAMPGLGMKRPLSDMASLDNTVIPKVKKNLDGSRQRIKAGDFDDVTKEILMTAGSIFRCLIVTQAPFPDTIAIETKLVKEAWHEACQLKGVDVQLTPSVAKIILRRTSHVRGELKTKMRSLTGSFFGFRASESREVIRQNRDLVEKLKNGSLFAFKDWESKTGIYKTELMQTGINNMWFVNRNDEGIIYNKYFSPLPTEVIALVLAAIECCIDEWATGLKENIKFTSAAYASVYHDHLDSLQRFDERTAPYKLLEKIRVNLHDTARFHAGMDTPLITPTSAYRISDDAFEDAIREYQLQEHVES